MHIWINSVLFPPPLSAWNSLLFPDLLTHFPTHPEFASNYFQGFKILNSDFWLFQDFSYHWKPCRAAIYNDRFEMSTIRCGGPQGVFHQIYGGRVQHAKQNRTQWDLRFCENLESHRFKINEKGGQLDR